MRVPQNVSLDIFFLTATLLLVIKFKYLLCKQHLVILCQTNVCGVGGGGGGGGGCERVGLVCVFKTTELIFLKKKIP